MVIKRWWLLKFRGVDHEETRKDRKSWILPLAAIGLIIIVSGIVAETYFEGKVSDTDAEIREHESDEITAAEYEAAAATRQAGGAATNAQNASVAAQKAIDSEHDLEGKAAILGKQIENARENQVWLGERRVIIDDKRKEFEKYLTQFNGQKAIFAVCGGQYMSRGDQEITGTAGALEAVLQGAEWKMESIPVRNTTAPGMLSIVIDDSCGTIGLGASVSFRNDAPAMTRNAAKLLQAVMDDVLQQSFPFSALERPPGLFFLQNQGDVHMLGADVIKVDVRMHPISPFGPSRDDSDLLKQKP